MKNAIQFAFVQRVLHSSHQEIDAQMAGKNAPRFDVNASEHKAVLAGSLYIKHLA